MERIHQPKNLKLFLDQKVELYNRREFVPSDPIAIPSQFARPADIEIAGLFAAVFSWGNRTTILRKGNELMERMDYSPHAFVLGYGAGDLKRLLNFKHRTFNATDLLYFLEFLQFHFRQSDSLETAFTKGLNSQNQDIEAGLNGFYDYFFSLKDVPGRTRKHLACPRKHSSCKRLNMFLRWMVRGDQRGVDFGIWKKISPSQLVCPLDLHVARVASRLGLISRKQKDWRCAIELTSRLRQLDPIDPVKYDFALFGLGIAEHF